MERGKDSRDTASGSHHAWVGMAGNTGTGKKKIIVRNGIPPVAGSLASLPPTPKTGWRESWIEIQGPFINQILLQHPNVASPIMRRGLEVGHIEEVSKEFINSRVIGKRHARNLRPRRCVAWLCLPKEALRSIRVVHCASLSSKQKNTLPVTLPSLSTCSNWPP